MLKFALHLFEVLAATNAIWCSFQFISNRIRSPRTYSYKDLTQEKSHRMFGLLLWNLIVVIGFLIWPLVHISVARFVVCAILMPVLYLVGSIEEFEDRLIEENSKPIARQEEKKDYELRNIELAKAIVNLEKQLLRARQDNPLTTEIRSTMKKKK
jgi:sensor histidine kinase YesM